MKQLQIGDYVMVAANKFEKVYSFGHFDQVSSLDFIIMNEELEISPNHLVAIVKGRSSSFVPASTVKVGDMIKSVKRKAPIEVTSITTRSSTGLYAPFTPSGTLLVNGFLVSSYVSLQADSATLKIGGISTGLSYQFLAHTFLYPHRFACFHFGNECPNETYSASGVSTWVERSHDFFEWLLQQNVAIQLVSLIPILFVIMMIGVMEFFITVVTMLVLFRSKVDMITTARIAQEHQEEALL